MKSSLFTRLVQQKALKILTPSLLILYLCSHASAKNHELLDATNKVISFTLIDADADVPIIPLLDNHTINLTKLPTKKLNIRANTQPSVVGSVVIVLNGQQRIENVAPYAANGDNNGNYAPWTPTVGTYHLIATPFSLKNGKGTAGEALTIIFHVVNDPARPELVVENYWDFTSTYRFLLEQGEDDKFYFTMKSSDNSTLPTPAAITPIDDVTNDSPIWLAFPSSTNQDTGYDFFVHTTGLVPGIYTATVIFGPVQGYDMEVVKVILEVSADPLPYIRFDPDAFQFTFEQNAGQETSEYTIIASDGNENGAAQVIGIDITTGQPAPWLSFSSASNFGTPYTFFLSTDMPAGTYYAELYGKAFERFAARLLSGKYKNAKATLELVLTPAFKVAQFVLINADTDEPIFSLHEGSTVAPLPNRNIQVRTFPEVTGSVKIVVNGQTRIENIFPYAAFGDNNGDYYPWNPTPGNYHIMATPYSEKNAKGQAGESLSLNFTVLSNGTISFETTRSAFSEETVKLNAYPNPLVSEATLEISLPKTEKVYIDLYSREMSAIRVFEGIINAHTVTHIPIDAGRLQNGIYYTRIIAGDEVISKKLIVAK